MCVAGQSVRAVDGEPLELATAPRVGLQKLDSRSLHLFYWLRGLSRSAPLLLPPYKINKYMQIRFRNSHLCNNVCYSIIYTFIIIIITSSHHIIIIFVSVFIGSRGAFFYAGGAAHGVFEVKVAEARRRGPVREAHAEAAAGAPAAPMAIPMF